MVVIELPIIVLTLFFSHKFKAMLTKASNIGVSAIEQNPTFVTKHLLEAEDRYIVLKKRQANLALLALLVSFFLHLLNIILYWGVDHG